MQAAVRSDQEKIAALRAVRDSLIIVVGAGLTIQSAGLPSDACPNFLRALVNLVLLEANEPPLGANERNTAGQNRWMQKRTTSEQQHDLSTVLTKHFPFRDPAVWLTLFEMRRPVIASSPDVHAATGLFLFLHGRLPTNENELLSVVLTWQSPRTEILAFFQGKVQKVLYREGFVIPHALPRTSEWAGSGNWILGKRYSIAKRFSEFEAIEQQMSRRPLFLVGIGSVIRSNPVQQNIRACANRWSKTNCFLPTVFRFVKRGELSVNFVVDFEFEDFTQPKFVGALQNLVQELVSKPACPK
jgi:hypothetical protein